MKKTMSQRYLEMFLEKGYTQVQTRSSKYTVVHKRGIGAKTGKEVDVYYFIGKNGSVRFNSKNCITNSVSLTEQFKIRLDVWEKSK